MSRTFDKFLDGRIKLIQPSTGYRAGIDPLFLSSSLHPKADDKILDVGCGVGTASIALAYRCPHVTITGIEIQENLVELALINLQTNGVNERVEVHLGDILSPPAFLKPHTFDHVITNPPYYEDGRSQPSPVPGKAQANTETVDLGKWIKCCLKFLKPKGTFTMIHRAERLVEVLSHLQNRAGEIVVFPLWPGTDKAAKRILIQARKNKGGELRLARGIVLHGGAKKYTPEAEAVLRHAHGIVL